MNNQEAIKILGQYDVSNLHFYTTDGEEIPFTEWSDAIEMAISALQEQEAKHSTESSITQKALDTISRQAAIDIFDDYNVSVENGELEAYSRDRKRLCDLPSAQPTLYGYSVEHLILIASVLQKENLPPERITEALTDIGRVVAIVRDEFVDNLRKAVEKLPSAQPEPQWIPVSERFPEENDYKSCIECLDGAVWYCTENVTIGLGYYYKSTKEWSTTDDLKTDGKVVAWKPLPEPYRAERRTDE